MDAESKERDLWQRLRMAYEKDYFEYQDVLKEIEPGHARDVIEAGVEVESERWHALQKIEESAENMRRDFQASRQHKGCVLLILIMVGLPLTLFFIMGNYLA